MTPASASLRIALTLVRGWTRLYTTGLPGELRHRRLAEIESDLWEHTHDSGDTAIDALAIVGRLLRGIPDDVGWRTGCVGSPVPAARWAVGTILAAAILTSSLWIFIVTRTLPLPPAPAPPNLLRRANYPPPPPPPPPPCSPPGIGRAPITPCTPY